MTGFAVSECHLPQGSFRAELRSVNHRSMDLQVRVPRAFHGLDAEIKAYLTKRIGRGSVEFRLENKDSSNAKSVQRLPQAKTLSPLIAEIQALHSSLGFSAPLSFPEILRTLSQFGAIPASDEAEKVEGPQFAAIQATLETLLEAFSASRLREGAHLVGLLNATVAQLRVRTAGLRSLRHIRDENFARRVQEKVEAVLKNAVDQAWLESRISQELALLADRADVEEELGRIDHHLSTFETTLQATQPGPVGRKLEFLLQELNREYTTLSNKAQDAKLQTEAVECKLLLEQLREQVLNLA